MEEDLRPLPLLMRPGLRLVFVGYNPGIESARRGHYYAFRGNVFWRQLRTSGLVEGEPGPTDDASLMETAGIGFTDLCPRPTVRASELSTGELTEGARRLYHELVTFAPERAVFSGRGIYTLFAREALAVSNQDLAGRGYGAQPERIGHGTIPWVIPSSSGLASRWHGVRLELLRELAAELVAEGSGRADKEFRPKVSHRAQEVASLPPCLPPFR